MEEDPTPQPSNSQTIGSPPPYSGDGLSGHDTLPVGVSASQLGINTSQHADHNPKRLMKLAIIPCVLLVLGLSIWIYLRNAYSYTTRTLDNGGYIYSFEFNRGASQQNIKGKNYLNGWASPTFQRVGVLGEPVTAPVPSSCAQIESDLVQVFSSTINGMTYPVCTLNNAIYEVGFTYGGKSHLFEVISKSAISVDIAEKIINSLTVARQS